MTVNCLTCGEELVPLAVPGRIGEYRHKAPDLMRGLNDPPAPLPAIPAHSPRPDLPILGTQHS